jgi:hypothetical protein
MVGIRYPLLLGLVRFLLLLLPGLRVASPGSGSGLVRPRKFREFCNTTGARPAFRAFLRAAVVVGAPAQQALQDAVAFPKHFVCFSAFVIVLPPIVGCPAPETFDSVNGGFASC